MQKLLTLSQIWKKTNGVYFSDPLVYLRVITADKPGPQGNPAAWFASCDPIEEGVWSVAIWDIVEKNKGQRYQWAFASVADQMAAKSIHEQIWSIRSASLSESKWVPISVNANESTGGFRVIRCEGALPSPNVDAP